MATNARNLAGRSAQPGAAFSGGRYLTNFDAGSRHDHARACLRDLERLFVTFGLDHHVAADNLLGLYKGPVRYERLAIYRPQVIIPLGLFSMIIQAIFFAWVYPRLFSTRREEWLGSALRFFGAFTVLAWSFTTLPVAAKYQMTSVLDFLKLETAFTILQFAVVAPLIALAYRGAEFGHAARSRVGATESSRAP